MMKIKRIIPLDVIYFSAFGLIKSAWNKIIGAPSKLVTSQNDNTINKSPNPYLYTLPQAPMVLPVDSTL